MEPSDRVYSHSSIVHYQIHHLAGLIADRNISCSNRTVVKDVYRLVSSCLSLWYTYKTHLKNIMFELTERKKNKLTTMFVSNFGRVESNLPFPLHGSGLQQTDEGIEHRGWTSLTILTFSLKIHVQQLIHLHGIFFRIPNMRKCMKTASTEVFFQKIYKPLISIKSTFEYTVLNFDGLITSVQLITYSEHKGMWTLQSCITPFFIATAIRK